MTTTLSRRPHQRDDQYRSLMRVSVLGGGVMGSDGARVSGGGGALLLDVGRGWFSFEGGIQYINTPVTVFLTNPNLGSPMTQNTLRAEYVGAALYAKYNYIESPGAAFSLKLGAMPAYLVNANQLSATYTDPATGGVTTMQPAEDDIFGLAGFTGTAPLTDSLSFVLDGTYYYGFTGIDANGTRSQGVMLALGLRYSL